MSAIANARLPLWQAAFVIFRRDYGAVVFSKAFLLFLVGPLFFLAISAGAGVLGAMAADSAGDPELGFALSPAENAAIEKAYEELDPLVRLPEIATIEEGTGQTPEALLADEEANLLAVVSGSLDAPRLTGPEEDIERWQGETGLLIAAALGNGPSDVPAIAITTTDNSVANTRSANTATATAGITMMFLLTMLLAGMVLSNLVEEKGNKIIEILAAAIPMDAVFVGKLFAMLAVSLTGIIVWGAVIGILLAFGGSQLPEFSPPAVGWPLFFALFVLYFGMAYLLIGSIFLTVGSMAPTVRDVQTISMPATILNLLVFFLATFAMRDMGSAIEIAAVLFPLSSPYMMIARAAKEATLWWHLAAFAWQVLWVGIFIRVGATLFRRTVLKSGGAGREKKKKAAAV